MTVKLVTSAALVALLVGCQGQGVGLSETQEEALSGGALGAAGGALLGAVAGAPALGAALGGAGGAAATALSEDLNL